ncbi:ABC transporter substrate-binding protein [Polynucleobacter kasalickyi]|uniref:Amino acid/amide ABC transporter substrate-binding protein, HAAT family n=1 Tax=Polynucleobacter kasalickyi TaxID=1938817 RepID=A0A1W1ZGI1_9BURK|nr:ABC transporter substrate-binding protein [Polynucleobacter kasalickyi]SMC47292.1 amino acid/amide ABC transporter substrate-binding protein, HAAT family [Polynucleobacter kasalickyi]
MSLDRRSFIQGTAAAGLSLAAPSILLAQSNEPVRIGLLTVKTGPLASGGIDMELGLKQWLAENNNMMGGKKVELTVADTGGVPANTKTKISELYERNKVHAVMGPLAAFEALAVDDYIKAQKIPTLSVAAAEDMTQRKPNPWFVRATSTSSQCAHPMAEYCAKVKGYKRMIMIADDIAYGHEMNAGFQRVFEENGGKIVQKLFSPLTVPDYGSFLAQLNPKVDAIFLGFAGSNGFRFIRQFNEYGLNGKMAIVGGMTAIDEAVLKNMGNEALGIETACWYSAELNNPINNKFAPAFRAANKYDPGFYAAATYTNAAVLDAAIREVNGNVANKEALMAALKKTNIPTARGPVKFDSFGNIVGDVYIRRVERKDGRLVNTVTKTYTNVSQFWTYDQKAFLANPVYSRDFPPAKNLES